MMKGHDVIIVIGLAAMTYITLGLFAGQVWDNFLNGPALWSWLIAKNLLTWGAFLGLGIWIGRRYPCSN